MAVKYDKNGNCESCGKPGSGFIDEVCMCLEEQEMRERWDAPLSRDQEDALEEFEHDRRQRRAEENEE